METTGCPEGYATDIAFELREATVPCSIPLAAYWSVLSCLLVVRFAAAVRQAMTWHHLNIKLERKHRRPFAVSMSFALVMLQVVTILCIGFNVANVYNGFSWMLVSLTMLPYFFQASFIMLRFVSLGERIIPLGRQLGVRPDEQGRSSLRRFSKGGRFLAFWQFISATISSITLMILTPIDSAHQDLHGTIGLAFKAQFLFTATTGMVYQLHRCVLVVKKMQRDLKEVSISSSRDALAKTQTSIRTMQRRMVIGFLMGVPTTMGLVLVAFHAIPRSVWWVVVYPTATEAVLAMGIEFFSMPKRARAGPNTDDKETADQVKMTSSSGNKVEPGISSPPSILVAALRPATEARDGEETNT